VWGWLEAYWNVVTVIGGVTVAVMLLVTAALPPLLAPLVLGPLAAVVLTALIAPAREATQAPDAPRRTEAQGGTSGQYHSPA
jgi:hypothetical protein